MRTPLMACSLLGRSLPPSILPLHHLELSCRRALHDRHGEGRPREHLVIVGCGWAGFELIRGIDHKAYNVTMVSPRNYFLFTPLLASTCVGTLEFRCIIEPVRGINSTIEYHQAWCENVDFERRQLILRDALNLSNHTDSQQFRLSYDKLVLAMGQRSNTFGIPGVSQHALFLKDIGDARRIRQRILECFEHALQPGLSEEERQEALHFTVVGGGPTGVEFAAELHDFIHDDLARIYPRLQSDVKISLYDVAPRILGAFDERLCNYASERFHRQGISLQTGIGVSSLDHHTLILSDGRKIPTRMTVWAAGLAPTSLAGLLTCRSDPHTGRLYTDHHLRLQLSPSSLCNDSVFALGDCAMIETQPLPCTAQVAKQQAQYLARQLNHPTIRSPFEFRPLGMMAYVGGWRAVIDLNFFTASTKTCKREETEVKSPTSTVSPTLSKNAPRKPSHVTESGRLAWLFWRSAYFSMAVSVRNKILIPIYWFLTWAFGRDISKF